MSRSKGHLVMVVGCGTMGSGIIYSFLSSPEITVIVVENTTQMIRKYLSAYLSETHYNTIERQGQVQVSPQLFVTKSIRTWAASGNEIPELVIEAVPEKMENKLEVYHEIQNVFGEKVIVGTNTSTLPLQKMADALKYPSSFVGVHYNHPAHIIPIVEVTKLSQSHQSHVQYVVEILKKCGKVPVVLLKPIDGFITNRLQHAMYREIYSLMEDGSVGAKDIDDVAKYMFGPRMCVSGLVMQKDCSGLDTHTYAQRQMVKVIANNTTCGKVLEEKFASGNLGLKSGQGFYDWKSLGEPARVQEDINGRLKKVYEFISHNNIVYDAPLNAKL